ncbi:hypothetical protein CTZ27_20965 [Streptomyces griseocarneus]|nr:hypothetical protein CTZ27_20965 [Streptomyces griseocarneus]
MNTACTHQTDWIHRPGETQCTGCGVIRFHHYAAVRPPGLAAAITPKRRDAEKADRAAAEWVMLHARQRKAPSWAGPNKIRMRTTRHAAIVGPSARA